MRKRKKEANLAGIKLSNVRSYRKYGYSFYGDLLVFEFSHLMENSVSYNNFLNTIEYYIKYHEFDGDILLFYPDYVFRRYFE